MALTTLTLKDSNGNVKTLTVSDSLGGGVLTNAFYMIAAGAEVTATNPLPVRGKIANPTATLTLPNSTTTYAAGDLVANSATAGSVTPLTFDLGSDEFMITGLRVISNRLTATTLGQFTLLLYTAAPTIATTGDDGVYASVVSLGSAKFIGSIDFSFDIQHADGYVGTGVPPVRAYIPVKLAIGSSVYGLVRARNAYARTQVGGTASETIEFILDGFPNS